MFFCTSILLYKVEELLHYGEAVSLRLDYRSHVFLQNGRTAMHYACALQDGSDIEDLLVQYGSDETIQDDVSYIMLHYLSNHKEGTMSLANDIEMFYCLSNHGEGCF